MTDLPPTENPTSNPPDKTDVPPATDRQRLTSDELIALFVALVGIGSIFFWIIQPKESPIDFAALTSGAPFANGTAPDNATGNSAESVINSSTPSATQPPANANAAIDPTAPATEDASSQARRPSMDSQTPTAGISNSGVKQLANGQPGNAPQAIASSAPQPSAAPTVTTLVPSLDNPGKPKAFTDVPETFWARQPIAALSSRGILDGFKDGSFQPNKPITRAEFAGILGKAFEKTKTKPAIQFQDIKPDYWATTAIDESIQAGFMTGYPKQQFKPDQLIPRVQMLVAIVTGLGLTPSGDPMQVLAKYRDVQDIPKWAIPKVAAAEAAGLLRTSQNTLTPNQPATRADAATYIYQALIKEGKIKP